MSRVGVAGVDVSTEHFIGGERVGSVSTFCDACADRWVPNGGSCGARLKARTPSGARARRLRGPAARRVRDERVETPGDHSPADVLDGALRAAVRYDIS